MEKSLSSLEKMQRLMRICPEVCIVPVSGAELWRVLLPKTAYYINSDAFHAEFAAATYERVIEMAWDMLTSADVIILADGRLSWKSAMVLGWDSDLDDWKNLPKPSMPLFKLATYMPKS